MNKPNIVILDSFAANPGDLSWEGIEALGDCTIYPRSAQDEIVERAKDAEILLLNKPLLTREILSRLPRLRFIAVQATGYNVVDVKAAREFGIKVSNVPAYSTDAVTQMTFALLLELMSKVSLHSEAVHAGEWVNSKDFTFLKGPIFELAGKTIGLVGFGNIAKSVAKVALAFGMKVSASARSKKEFDGVTFTSTDEIFSRSDIVSLHCPMTPETERIVNTRTLAMMKKSAILINTARGGLVEEKALADALNSNRLAGAGLDVLSTEPPARDNPLLTAKNCVLTPHIAWAPRETRERLIGVTEENVKAYLAGTPVNLVS